MPRADVDPLPIIRPGWGCNCMAFKFGEPTPEQALRALAASVNVTVMSAGGDEEGRLRFVTWTEPDNRYETVWDPKAQRAGWCKHSVACCVCWTPWHRMLALGADSLLERVKTLDMLVRKLKREIKRNERKSGSR